MPTKRFPLEPGGSDRLPLDGAPLPGSPGDPEQLLAGAANVIFLVAGLSLVLGLAALALDVSFLKMLGANGWAILAGLVYGGLGFQVKKRRMWALGLAMILYVLDGALTLAMSVEPGATPGVGGIFIRTLFTLMMVRGFGAIRALESRPRSRRARRPAPSRPRNQTTGGVGPAQRAAMNAAKRKALAGRPLPPRR